MKRITKEEYDNRIAAPYVPVETAGEKPVSVRPDTRSPTSSARDPVLPTVTSSTGNATGEWLARRPWIGQALKTTAGALLGPMGEAAASRRGREFLGESAKTGAKTAISPFVQLPKTLAAEAAGAMGDEALRTEILKPTELPIVGKIKQPSAAVEAAEAEALTPLETAEQALETTALIPVAAPATAVKRTLVPIEKRVARKAERSLLEYIMPKTTRKAGEATLLGEEERRVAKEGLAGKIKIQPGKRDKEIAETVKGIVDPRKSAQENILSLEKEISRTAEKDVRPFLRANMAPFNQRTLNARLRAIEMPTVFKADKTLSGAYDLVRKRMMDVVAKYPKTTEGLWDARKEFDQIVKREFPRTYESATDTAVTRAIKDMRRETNKFIIDSTPLKDNAFKIGMQRMSDMYEAAENIAEKGAAEVGTTAIGRFKKTHPTTVELGKAAAAGLGIGTAFSSPLFRGE